MPFFADARISEFGQGVKFAVPDLARVLHVFTKPMQQPGQEPEGIWHVRMDLDELEEKRKHSKADGWRRECLVSPVTELATESSVHTLQRCF